MVPNAVMAPRALIHHPVDNVLKALKGHFECPVKLHGIAIQTKFATHVRWSVLPSPGFSPAIVLIDEHGEEGNDVLSLIVRNLSIDECLFNKGTIVQGMDIQMSSLSAKPGLDQKTKRTNGTVEDPKYGVHVYLNTFTTLFNKDEGPYLLRVF